MQVISWIIFLLIVIHQLAQGIIIEPGYHLLAAGY